MVASNVPEAIARAFADKGTISGPELCRLLPMDAETLRRHCEAGNISYVRLGHGHRRSFTLAAISRFLVERTVTESPPDPKPRRVGTRQPAPGWEGGCITARHEMLKAERQQKRAAEQAQRRAGR